MLHSLAFCLALAAPHPNSHSSSRVVVSGRHVELELRCQAQSLIESLHVDADANGVLDARELDAARAKVDAYLRARFELFEDANASVPLAFGPLELAFAKSEGGRFAELLVDAHAAIDAPRELERLTLSCRLFVDSDPFHRHSSTVIWNGAEPASFVFAEGAERWEFEPANVRRRAVFASYVREGVEHIATGYDHVAFLLALLVASRRLRSIVGFVTAFTAAHSITLACAALGFVHVPSRLVEMAIAVSIAWVAAENLFSKKPATRWVEAFGFGLIHGLGFAGAIGDSLMAEPMKVTALVGFNLGVELGQLVIVLAVAGLVRVLPGDRSLAAEARAWFAPRWLRLATSAVVVVLGVWWFAERARM